MVERFTEQGLRIIELGALVEKEFARLEQLTNSLAPTLQQEEGGKLRIELSKIDQVLMHYSLALDALGELSAKVKEERRSVLLRIQSVQSTIDNLKQKYLLL